jgi:hypothetical protein
MTSYAASPSKARAVLRLWMVALAISAGLAAAGERWPHTLRPDPAVVAALVLGVPLLMALLLLRRWPLPGVSAHGPAGHRGESSD